jgi:hypothetical protein
MGVRSGFHLQLTYGCTPIFANGSVPQPPPGRFPHSDASQACCCISASAPDMWKAPPLAASKWPLRLDGSSGEWGRCSFSIARSWQGNYLFLWVYVPTLLWLKYHVPPFVLIDVPVSPNFGWFEAPILDAVRICGMRYMPPCCFKLASLWSESFGSYPRWWNIPHFLSMFLVQNPRGLADHAISAHFRYLQLSESHPQTLPVNISAFGWLLSSVLVASYLYISIYIYDYVIYAYILYIYIYI